MSDNKRKVETLLPCGERIRPLLAKSCITDTDLKNLLSQRGVFIGNSQKQLSIPLIATSILSPKEFETLQEKQKQKEDSIKFRTSNISCDNDKPLVEMLPNDLIDTSKLDVYTDTLEFDTDLSFGISEKNEMVAEYKIRRNDVTKDWANTDSIYEGRIVIKKDDTTKKIEFISEYTSSETQDINKEVLKCVKNHFQANNYIKTTDDLETITANDFSNLERFKFMLSLTTDSPSGILEFETIKNVEIGPDKSKPIPTEADWMARDVKNMIINGDALQNLEFIQKDKYHDFLILREIEAKYKFNYAGGKGSCIIEFGFPHYFRTRNISTEFQVEMVHLYLYRENSEANKKNITRFLIEEFNNLKAEKYKMIKSK
jgi:hypothetical protein